MADSLILMILALVVFGPRRLPQIGRQIGKLMYEFRKASNDFKFQMEEELRMSEEADRRKREEEERLKNAALAPPAQTVEAQAGIGAVESPAAAPYPPEAQYPTTYSPELMTKEEHQYPRVAPPSTGEQVSRSTATPAADSTVAEANIGAEPAAPSAAPDSTIPPTETVSQHG